MPEPDSRVASAGNADSVTNGTDSRIDCSPENIEQGLAKLVLGLIELL